MLGLTLEGGGAKGAYQIGAWKAFKKLNLEFQGISGTSVGALNGALMMQDEFDLAYEVWYNINPTKIMEMDDKIYEMIVEDELSTKNIQVIYEEIKLFVKGLGLDPKPLRELMSKYLKEDVIRKSHKTFGFVTVCLTDRRPMEIYKEDVPENKMLDYLMASSYLPIFKSRKLDGKVFLDGGFYNNLPIEMLYNKGYKKIIAVRLLSRGRIKKVEHDDLEVVYITPNQSLGGIMDFSRDKARHNITLGYFDTLRVFENLRGRSYYLKGHMDDNLALKFFMEINENCIKKLGDLFNLSHSLPINRLLLEGIIPKFISLMELEKNATYGDVLIGVIENMAACKNIEPFKIYSITELMEKIIYLNSNKNIDECEKDMGNFIINEIRLRLDKEKLLQEAIKIMLKNNNCFFIPSP